MQETAVVREAAVKEASNDEWARLVKPGRRGPIDLKARAEALKAKQAEEVSCEADLAERFGYEVIEHEPQPEPEPEPEPVKAPPVVPAIIIEPEKPKLALVKSKPVPASTSDRKSLNVDRHWRESLPLNASQAEPARLYLQGRKVLPRGGADWLDNDCVRFHPAFPYWDTVTEVDMETGEERETIAEIGKFPAIVCAIVNNKGEILTLHRTYLSSTGSKADVESPRKMMPVPEGKSIRGAAIQMGTPVDGVLGVAEGLETALSAYRATGIATWSTVNATLLEGFTPPAGVHTVLVWADKDRSCTGESAAMRLKLRLQQQGIRVIVILPTAPIPSGSKGIDWNDVMIRQGISGFPSLALLRSVVGG
ncbi:DNA primase [Pseudomonas zeshuii]|nr:DNA primase [Pseudomonas zeshuii]